MPAGPLTPRVGPPRTPSVDPPRDAGPPGWYGKLAPLGDFAHRRLDDAVVARLDAWLSGWVATSRHALGAGWLPAYLGAPVLRFAWAPGVLDAGWWFGVLMPSCDSAGRYFPLWVAGASDRPPADRPALDRLGRWFDHVAAAATATLGERASVDAFEAALAAAPDARPASGPATGLAHLDGCSLWWTGDAPGGGGPLTVHSGLPDADALSALFFATAPNSATGADPSAK